MLETRVVSRQATGDTTLALADLGAITLGLDISAPMLQRAESRAELGEDTRESADMLKVIAEEVREAYARIQERLD
ncbi:MAG: class I SAM-dependent methyltransferase [Pseudomonadales bacterium]|nr:class I SAM-dependent methyltransferase [Pseudomonadales bacterium]MDP6469765.1 class I SAM-dependent methyltransferase [Pseudomonadales bacterium]MDP6827633.1 class I SAM-dependent methyltransferase [Pseudomonadales bacterium]MDP6972408.1 class I SAM-dependent methyltransferase [Pseudomonadales bacterium]